MPFFPDSRVTTTRGVRAVAEPLAATGAVAELAVLAAVRSERRRHSAAFGCISDILISITYYTGSLCTC